MNNSKYYNLCCKVLPKTAWALMEPKRRGGPLGHELIPYIVANNSIGFALYLNIYTKKREEILITKNNISEVKHLWLDIQRTISVFS